MVIFKETYRLEVVTLLNQWSLTDPCGVVVWSFPHDYATCLDEDILTLLPDRVLVLCGVCVVALGDILLSALCLLPLLNLLLLLLPHYTNHSISILHTVREVYSSILKMNWHWFLMTFKSNTSPLSGISSSLWLSTILTKKKTNTSLFIFVCMFAVHCFV